MADSLGMMASAACAFHCAVIPALLVAGATLPFPFLADERFHRAMLLLIIPSAILAFGLGCRRHKDKWVLILGTLGLVGVVVSGFFLHDIVGESGERIATLASAAILIAAHFRNFRICRSDDCAHEPA